MALAGLLVSVVALAVALGGYLISRDELKLARRLRARDFEATVVVEELGCRDGDDERFYELRVTNAGPAVARDVTIEMTSWGDGPFGEAVSTVDVAPALLRGEQRAIVLRQPKSLKLDGREGAVEVMGLWFDDNGLRTERLALVMDDGLLLAPRNPSARKIRRPFGLRAP